MAVFKIVGVVLGLMIGSMGAITFLKWVIDFPSKVGWAIFSLVISAFAFWTAIWVLLDIVEGLLIAPLVG